MKLYVYADHENRVVKIGVTENSAERRIREHMGVAANSYRVVCETGHLDADDAFRIESLMIKWASLNGYQRAFGRETFFGEPDELAAELCELLEREEFVDAIPREVRDSSWFRRRRAEQEEARRQSELKETRRKHLAATQEAKQRLEIARAREEEAVHKLEALVAEKEPLLMRIGAGLTAVIFGVLFIGWFFFNLDNGEWIFSIIPGAASYYMFRFAAGPSYAKLSALGNDKEQAGRARVEAERHVQRIITTTPSAQTPWPSVDTKTAQVGTGGRTIDDYNAIRRLALETDDPERLAELAAKAHRYGFPGLASAIRRGKEFL